MILERGVKFGVWYMTGLEFGFDFGMGSKEFSSEKGSNFMYVVLAGWVRDVGGGGVMGRR